jgi:hypothetical protein
LNSGISEGERVSSARRIGMRCCHFLGSASRASAPVAHLGYYRPSSSSVVVARRGAHGDIVGVVPLGPASNGVGMVFAFSRRLPAAGGVDRRHVSSAIALVLFAYGVTALGI